jgi:hypothetical protein
MVAMLRNVIVTSLGLFRPWMAPSTAHQGLVISVGTRAFFFFSVVGGSGD